MHACRGHLYACRQSMPVGVPKGRNAVTWRHRRPVLAMPSLCLLVTMAATKSAAVSLPAPAVALLPSCCACCHGGGCASSAGSAGSRWYLCKHSGHISALLACRDANRHACFATDPGLHARAPRGVNGQVGGGARELHLRSLALQP